MMIKADMHIHSYNSDGTYSFDTIIEKAKESHTQIISITDHNCLKAYDDLSYKEDDVQIIVGVELDCVWQGIYLHVLGYGIDLEKTDFHHFVEKNNEKLEQVNIELLKKVMKDHPECSLEDYNEYIYDQKKGGWKLLHYFVDRGLSESIWDSFRIYSEYNHSYTCVDFPSVFEVCEQIHKAHGKAVLAHPQKAIRPSSYEELKEILVDLLSCGLDGIECYYPSQDEKTTAICVEICHENNLMITCGCDCHGEFEKTEIGQLEIPLEYLDLKDLI